MRSAIGRSARPGGWSKPPRAVPNHRPIFRFALKRAWFCGCPTPCFVGVGALTFRAMTDGLKRYYGQKHLHLVTFSCYHRLPLLGSAHSRNLFVETLGKIRDRYGFGLVGYVVMPEHVHLLISEPERGAPSVVLQVLKERVSRRIKARSAPHLAGSFL
jgi:REP element-mobilizing transposase RayT